MSPGKRFERYEVVTKLVCSGLLGISSPKEDEATAAAVVLVVPVQAVPVPVQAVGAVDGGHDPEVERKVQVHQGNRGRDKLLRVKLERMLRQLRIPQHRRQHQQPHRLRAQQERNKPQVRVVVDRADAVPVVVDRVVVSVGDALSPREPTAWC